MASGESGPSKQSLSKGEPDEILDEFQARMSFEESEGDSPNKDQDKRKKSKKTSKKDKGKSGVSKETKTGNRSSLFLKLKKKICIRRNSTDSPSAYKEAPEVPQPTRTLGDKWLALCGISMSTNSSCLKCNHRPFSDCSRCAGVALDIELGIGSLGYSSSCPTPIVSGFRESWFVGCVVPKCCRSPKLQRSKSSGCLPDKLIKRPEIERNEKRPLSLDSENREHTVRKQLRLTPFTSQATDVGIPSLTSEEASVFSLMDEMSGQEDL